MRKCKTCDGYGELATDELDRDSGQFMRGVGSETCPDCGGTGEVENSYKEQFND